MRRTRLINVIAIFVNLAIVGCFFVGFYFKFLEACVKDFQQINNLGKQILSALTNFIFLTAIVNFITSLIMMFVNGKSAKAMRDRTPRGIFILRYIAMGMSAVSLFAVILALFTTPDATAKAELFTKGANLYFNLLMPLLSVLLFAFLELEQKNHFAYNFIPLAAFTIYVGGIFTYMLMLKGKGNLEAAAKFAPHPFFLITEELVNASGLASDVTPSVARSILVTLIALSFGLPTLLWLLNRFMCSVIIGYEYVEIDNKDKVIRPISYKALPTSHKKGAPIYHVSMYKRKLDNYQVKTPKNEIKIFATKEEAIDYASMLAKKQKGSVRVHKFLGRFKYNH